MAAKHEPWCGAPTSRDQNGLGFDTLTGGGYVRFCRKDCGDRPGLPDPMLAFIAALPAGAGGFAIEYEGWRLSREPRLALTGLQGWVPPMPPDVYRDVAEKMSAEQAYKTSAAYGSPLAPVRHLTDVSSLARPMPVFEDDPLAPEDDAAPAGPALTDRARAEFAAATAPKLDAG